MTVELMSPGAPLQLCSTQEPSLVWGHDFSFADGKRGPLEKKPKGRCGSLLMGQAAEDTRVREGPLLSAGPDLPFDFPGKDWTLVQPWSPEV